MGTCAGCGKVFGVFDMQDGYCKNCATNVIKKEIPKLESFVGFEWWRAWAWLGLTIGNLYLLGSFKNEEIVIAFVLIAINSILMIYILRYNKYAFLIATVLSINPLLWIINGIYLKNRWNHPKVNNGQMKEAPYSYNNPNNQSQTFTTQKDSPMPPNTPLHTLPSGTQIGSYEIIRVLGEGGFGITYLAQDINLHSKVVIKEYFPNEFAIRNTNNPTVHSKTLQTEHFSKGLQRFKEEAQTLAKFNHPSIVRIIGYFEAFNTAYFAMEYEEGIDLGRYLKEKNRPLTQEEILSIMMPILEGLKEVHKHNYLHRDIKPENILLRANHSPVLIDFGASKLAIQENSRSITSMLTEGYAPLEQYSTDIKQQGAFTDLYAIGAVIYKMITTKTPPSAQTRSVALLQDEPDPLQSLTSLNLKGYTPSFLNAVQRALDTKSKARPQSVQEFQGEIVGEMEAIHTQEKIQEATKNGDVRKTIAIIVFFVLLIGGYTWKSEHDKTTQALQIQQEIAQKEARQQGEAKVAEAKRIEDETRQKEEARAKQEALETKNQEEAKAAEAKRILEETEKKIKLEQSVKDARDALNTNDYPKAFKLFSEACDGGKFESCAVLGAMYELGKGVKQDYSKAVEFYTKACDGGHAMACDTLGVMYFSGNGVRQDNNKAFELFTRACDDGYAMGCNNLGTMYGGDKGIPQDASKAAELYQKACDGGEVLGCTNMGGMYVLGIGVKQDFFKATELYQKACDGGNAMGCNNLGVIYERGDGVRQDNSKAAELYQKACDGGNAASCFTLGSLYENSKGVKQDTSKAKELYGKACDMKNKEGCEAYNRLSQQTPQSLKSTPANALYDAAKVESFLKALLKSGCFSTVNDISIYYAANVTKYFSFTNPSHQDIYRDNVKYCKRWPYLSYTLNSFDITRNYNEYGIEYADVTIYYSYEVSNSKKSSTGSSSQYMTLILENGRIKVKSSITANTKSSQKTTPQNSTYEQDMKWISYYMMTGINNKPNAQTAIKSKLNSKGVNIYCLHDMSICKTEDEVVSFAQSLSRK